MNEPVCPYKLGPWVGPTIEYAVKFRDLHRLPDDEPITVAVSGPVRGWMDDEDIATLKSNNISVVVRDE